MSSPALQSRTEDMSHHPRIHASGAGILNVIAHSIGAGGKLEDDAQLIHEKVLLGNIRLTDSALQLLESSYIHARNAATLLGHALKASSPNTLPHSLCPPETTPRYLALADESFAILAEQDAHDARVIEESQPKAMLVGADIDGGSFVPGNFSTKESGR